MMPVTMAMIIAVSTDAMILFHSNDGIDALSPYRRSGRQPTATIRRRRKSDSGGQLNRIVRRIMPLPACRRSGHVVAPYAPELYRMYHSALPRHPIILIPTRLAAARLPRKPLADIVEREGGRAVLTDPELPTGSDRIHAAI